MRPIYSALFAILAVSLIAMPGTLAAKDTVTLRINDAEGEPGGLAPVVLRTYAPRTVGQGQICLQADSGSAFAPNPSKNAIEPDAVPWIALESYAVLSSAGDAISEGVFDALDQAAFLVFESLSGTINADDGPMVVLFFRVAENAPPETEFDLIFDADDTFLIDPAGEPIELELRAGRFKILKPREGDDQTGFLRLR